MQANNVVFAIFIFSGSSLEEWPVRKICIYDCENLLNSINNIAALNLYIFFIGSDSESEKNVDGLCKKREELGPIFVICFLLLYMKIVQETLCEILVKQNYEVKKDFGL